MNVTPQLWSVPAHMNGAPGRRDHLLDDGEPLPHGARKRAERQENAVEMFRV